MILLNMGSKYIDVYLGDEHKNFYHLSNKKNSHVYLLL